MGRGGRKGWSASLKSETRERQVEVAPRTLGLSHAGLVRLQDLRPKVTDLGVLLANDLLCG